MQGEQPPVQTAMDLYHILSESDTHLRQPIALETQLLADEDMDDEVSKSMLQLLQVSSSSALAHCNLPIAFWALQPSSVSTCLLPISIAHTHCLSPSYMPISCFLLQVPLAWAHRLCPLPAFAHCCCLLHGPTAQRCMLQLFHLSATKIYSPSNAA